jgi:CRP/FNR family cyclic AMP-dependent transcriptional regulator
MGASCAESQGVNTNVFANPVAPYIDRHIYRQPTSRVKMEQRCDSDNRPKLAIPKARYLWSGFSKEAFDEWTSLLFPRSYQENVTVFSERQSPKGIYVLLSGNVRLSISSREGKCLSIRIAKPGDVLGLSAVVSGTPFEMTAETLYPAKIALIESKQFHRFLARHPDSYKAVIEQLSKHITMASEQLRRVGLSSSMPQRLAGLLLEWGDSGQSTERGSRFRVSMTHTEIGNFIGASRESVTRTLSLFKELGLVHIQGSMMNIPDSKALGLHVRS